MAALMLADLINKSTSPQNAMTGVLQGQQVGANMLNAQIAKGDAQIRQDQNARQQGAYDAAMKADQASQERMQAFRQMQFNLASNYSKMSPQERTRAILQMSALFPEQQEVVGKMYAQYDTQEKKYIADQYKSLYNRVRSGDVEGAKALAEKLVNAFKAGGLDQKAQEIRAAIDLVEKGGDAGVALLEQALVSQISALDPAFIDQLSKQNKEQREQELFPDEKLAAKADREIKQSGAKYADRLNDARIKQAYAALRASGQAGKAKAISSVRLPGGLVQFQMSDATVKTVDAANKVLAGEEAKQAFFDHEQRGVFIQGQRAAARAVGGLNREVIKDDLDAMKNAEQTIPLLDQGIMLLEQEGAETGYVQQFLPNVTNAAQQLENVIGQLGLRVVGSYTFGALSESELNFALRVAAPSGNDTQELIAWFRKKKATLQKVVKAMREKIKYMSQGGRNIGDYLRYQDGEAPTAQPQRRAAPAQSGSSLVSDLAKAIRTRGGR